MSANPPNPPQFDDYAAGYDQAINQGLAVSGEGKDFFAQGRIAWLATCLRQRKFIARVALDFGCGTGTATPFLLASLGVQKVIGTEVSAKSLEIARQTYPPSQSQFELLGEYQPKGNLDLAYCNGVFHHIPLPERAGAVECVFRSLRSGGYFALWENNPWNPGTRYVMSRIPFDRDAITLTAPETRRLLRAGGFSIIRTDFLFLFPRSLRWLRFLEKPLAGLPLGAQYQVLALKP